jgi:hypothetical protein
MLFTSGVWSYFVQEGYMVNSTSEVPKTGNIMPAKSDEESITAESGPDAGQGSSAEGVVEVQSNIMALDGDLRREFETCVIAVLKARKRAGEAIEEYGIFLVLITVN